MILEKTSSAIKSFLETQSLGIPIYTPRSTANIVYPCVKISEIDAIEDEVLDNVYNPAVIEVALESIPNDSPEGGTQKEDAATHGTDLKTALQCLVFNHAGLKVFDYKLSSLSTEERNGRNADVFTLEIVCCEV